MKQAIIEKNNHFTITIDATDGNFDNGSYEFTFSGELARDLVGKRFLIIEVTPSRRDIIIRVLEENPK